MLQNIVYNNDESAISVMNSLYANMSFYNLIAPNSLSSLTMFAGLSADELVLSAEAGNTSSNPQLFSYYNNSLSAGVTGFEYWSLLFKQVYVCNEVIEKLSKANNLTPTVMKQLLERLNFCELTYISIL